MLSASCEERVYALLFLFSVALRPLADGGSPDSIQLERADLGRLAKAAGARVGRNKFIALMNELADDAPDAVEVHRRRGNRWTFVLYRVAFDPYSWADEVLEPLGLADVPAAIEAATALGIDTTTALPADVLQAAPANEQDDWDEDEDQPVKVCTRCGEEKPADDDAFPVRPNGRLRSWCRLCANQATRAWRERRRPAGTPRLAAEANRRTSATARTTVAKVCTGCQRHLPLGSFHGDVTRSDGRAVRCKSCRQDAAYRGRLRCFTDY
jgi:hypothetical protein